MDEGRTIDAGGPNESEGEAAGPAASPPPPPFADGEERAVDPRSVQLARLVGIPFSVVLPLPALIGITLGRVLGGMPSAVYLPLLAALLVLTGVALVFAYRYPAAHHRHLRYRVDPDGLCIRRGVFWRKTIWISITRVQHTDVSQGPLQRRFGLAKLTVHTAGTEGASIELSGLEHGIATRLADHLRPHRSRHGS